MPILQGFSTPAYIQDLQGSQQNLLNQLWNTNVEAFTQQAMPGDPSFYYDPTRTSVPMNTPAAPITWPAFPNRINQYAGTATAPPPNLNKLSQLQVWSLADTGYYIDKNGQRQTFPQVPTKLCPLADWGSPLKPYGPYGPRGWQDEYCEWSVAKNTQGKITRVDFVCENPEYWHSLWRISPQRVVDLYQSTLNFGLPPGSGHAITVTMQDLQLMDPTSGKPVIDPSTGRPAYNGLNRWNRGPVSIRGGGVNNTGGAIHLTSTPNTLQTELGLAGAATVQRKIGNTDPQKLICCSQYGQEYRHSDPHIGQGVNQAVSGPPVALASLADPVGLYIQMPDLSTGTFKLPPDPKLPPGATAADCWQIVRGAASIPDPINPGQSLPGNFILHAVFQIPAAWIQAGVKFTVGDIQVRVRGQWSTIQYAAQVVETFEIGLFARPIPTSNTPIPQACLPYPPSANPDLSPVQAMYADLWNACYNTQIPNPVGVPMSLASNTVIVPAQVNQGASGLSLVLTCTGVVLGPSGQLPTVTADDPGIKIAVTKVSTVTYAAPGNSYPSPFQLLNLQVSVANSAKPGLKGLTVTNYGQPQGASAPALLNVVSSSS